MVMQPPSGTVTFPFTDIEGSTRLWEERPDEMRAMVADHDERFRSAIEHNGGYGFATGGDEFAAAFGPGSRRGGGSRAGSGGDRRFSRHQGEDGNQRRRGTTTPP